MADRNYIQASPVLASYPEYKNTYIYLTFRVKNKYDWNGTGNVYLKYIGRKAGNVPIENNFIWDNSKKWCFHDTSKITPMSNGTIDGQLFGNSNGITLTERLWDSTISDKYFSSDPNSPLYNRYYIFTPPTQGTSVQDEETYIIMRYETDNDGNVITLDTNGTAPEMIRLSFEIPTGCDLQTVMLYDVRIHAKSKNASCISVIYEDVLIDGNNNIKYVDNEVFTITSNVANGNGSITPYEGTKTFVKGSTANYTFVPDSGYEVQYAIIDGVIRQGATSQGFINIHEDHSIIVYFIKQQQVTYECTANYVAYPSSDIIQPGVNPCPGLPYTKSDIALSGNFEVTPNIRAQYRFTKILRKDANGEHEVSVTPENGKYTFNNIISNTDIIYTLEKAIPFRLDYSTDGNGTIEGNYSGYIDNITPESSVTLSYYHSDDKKIEVNAETNPDGTAITTNINKSQKTISINKVTSDIILQANFPYKPDPDWFSNWMLKLKVLIPSNNYTFSFNISNYNNGNTADLIDCNYNHHNPDVPNVMDKNYRLRQRCHPTMFQVPGTNQFDILFVRSGTYVIAFNFLPKFNSSQQYSQILNVSTTYSDDITELSYNASTTTSSEQPYIQINSANSLQKFEYLNIKRDDEYFNNNIKIEGTGNPNTFSFNSGDNPYLKQIGNEKIYNEHIRQSPFRGKIIHEWPCQQSNQTLAKNVEVLEGYVFENATLPVTNLQISGNTYNNCLYMELARRVRGGVFNNINGYNTSTGIIGNVETIIISKTRSEWKISNSTDVIQGHPTGSTGGGIGIFANISGLKKIALNHSNYKDCCFNGLDSVTQLQPVITTEDQKYFKDSTYFKLLIKNTNVHFNDKVFDYPLYNRFKTENVILYLPESVIQNEVVGNTWTHHQNSSPTTVTTTWAAIFSIEHYAPDLYNGLQNFL